LYVGISKTFYRTMSLKLQLKYMRIRVLTETSYFLLTNKPVKCLINPSAHLGNEKDCPQFY